MKAEYAMYFENWKIVSDYVNWVESGGCDIYGCVDVARQWARSLLQAQNDCFAA